MTEAELFTDAQLFNGPLMEATRLFRDLGLNPLTIIAIIKAVVELFKLIKNLFA